MDKENECLKARSVELEEKNSNLLLLVAESKEKYEQLQAKHVELSFAYLLNKAEDI